LLVTERREKMNIHRHSLVVSISSLLIRLDYSRMFLKYKFYSADW